MDDLRQFCAKQGIVHILDGFKGEVAGDGPTVLDSRTDYHYLHCTGRDVLTLCSMQEHPTDTPIRVYKLYTNPLYVVSSLYDVVVQHSSVFCQLLLRC